MHTTQSLIDLFEKSNENCTDYRAAKLLEIDKSTISEWRRKGSVMKDETGLKIAETLGLEPDYVLACLAAERAKDSQTRVIWEGIANRLHSVAATFLLAVFVTYDAPAWYAAIVSTNV